jgi:hypothetical protein
MESQLAVQAATPANVGLVGRVVEVGLGLALLLAGRVVQRVMIEFGDHQQNLRTNYFSARVGCRLIHI